ncbi:hypothetical protein RBA41_28295 [Massilia sp. CCM 9210]|uniref:hypothetical protein n=1 Tax=Massilia scottii TaxID=3057166 RepID=UPI00279680D0|nr:hypothetical protein [Massilia sp. CCM 9210]MDQ1817211.1 hypothetical protein [Massilia sp. CCM 9210]
MIEDLDDCGTTPITLNASAERELPWDDGTLSNLLAHISRTPGVPICRVDEDELDTWHQRDSLITDLGPVNEVIELSCDEPTTESGAGGGRVKDRAKVLTK